MNIRNNNSDINQEPTIPLKHAIIYIICMICVTAFYFIIWQDAPIVGKDSFVYMEIARDLTDFKLDKFYERTIGYPVLLLLTGSSQQPTDLLFLIQLLLHFVSVFLLIILLYKFAVPTGWIIVFFIFSILPPAAGAAGLALTENPTQVLLIFGVVGLVMWHWKGGWLWLILSAFSWAYCGITRPTYQLLPAAIAVMMLMLPRISPSLIADKKRSLISCAAILLTGLFIIGGVMLYNQAAFGYGRLTSLSVGYFLGSKTVAVLEDAPDEYAEIRDILISHRDSLAFIDPEYYHSVYDYEWAALSEIQEATGLSKAEISDIMMDMNLKLIKSNPMVFLEEIALAMGRFWLPMAAGSEAGSYPKWFLLLYTMVHFLMITLFFLILIAIEGIAALSQQLYGKLVEGDKSIFSLRLFGILLISVSLFYTAVLSTIASTGYARYRWPMDLLILFATIILIDTFLKFRKRLSRISTND
ncbi:MAG: hypothetical protein GF315_06155 [candidate division Zixibacteria bacterium]|nr:hypothetical protein [candidate division Zixibacteria bacterium]